MLTSAAPGAVRHGTLSLLEGPAAALNQATETG